MLQMWNDGLKTKKQRPWSDAFAFERNTEMGAIRQATTRLGLLERTNLPLSKYTYM